MNVVMKCVVGFCPGLYDALQTAAHQERPYELVDDGPRATYQYNDEDRQELINVLLEGLTGSDAMPIELNHYLTAAYEAIDDKILKGLIDDVSLSFLKVNEHGYYLAGLERT